MCISVDQLHPCVASLQVESTNMQPGKLEYVNTLHGCADSKDLLVFRLLLQCVANAFHKLIQGCVDLSILVMQWLLLRVPVECLSSLERSHKMLSSAQHQSHHDQRILEP